jgi:outer membrane protein
LDLSVLDLSQLLELPSPQNFGIAVPQIPDAVLLPSGSAEEIYAEAVGQRPAVRAEQLRLNAAEMNVSIAKSSLYPSLDLNGGIGTNYYKSSGYAAASFMDQVRNNFSQYVGISLSVPIFSRFATRNNIRSANLSKLSQQVQLENTRKSLYKEIQQAWYNAVASGSKLRSCEDALKSAETSFELIRAKYENGKATATEFSESRTSLMKAESDLLQARFENLFQVKLLDFYRGKPLYSTPENG